MVRAIFFDAGETLITMQPSAYQIFRDILDSFGITADEQSLRRGYEAANRYYEDFFFRNVENVGAMSRLTEEERKKVWVGYNALVLDALGVEDAGHTLASAINDSFDARVRFVAFPEASSVLERLEGYTLGVISNWNLSLKIRDVFDGLGLSRYFSFLLASCEVGYDKPHPGIFRMALQKAGEEPHQALHVGDSVRADVAGARSVGIRPILIDRHDANGSPDCVCIKNLEELLRHLT